MPGSCGSVRRGFLHIQPEAYLAASIGHRVFRIKAPVRLARKRSVGEKRGIGRLEQLRADLHGHLVALHPQHEKIAVHHGRAFVGKPDFFLRRLLGARIVADHAFHDLRLAKELQHPVFNPVDINVRTIPEPRSRAVPERKPRPGVLLQPVFPSGIRPPVMLELDRAGGERRVPNIHPHVRVPWRKSAEPYIRRKMRGRFLEDLVGHLEMVRVGRLAFRRKDGDAQKGGNCQESNFHREISKRKLSPRIMSLIKCVCPFHAMRIHA